MYTYKNNEKKCCVYTMNILYDLIYFEISISCKQKSTRAEDIKYYLHKQGCSTFESRIVICIKIFRRQQMRKFSIPQYMVQDPTALYLRTLRIFRSVCLQVPTIVLVYGYSCKSYGDDLYSESQATQHSDCLGVGAQVFRSHINAKSFRFAK